jgi:hypothetical protein
VRRARRNIILAMVGNLTSTRCSQTPQLVFDVLKAFSGLLQHIEVSSCKSVSSLFLHWCSNWCPRGEILKTQRIEHHRSLSARGHTH